MSLITIDTSANGAQQIQELQRHLRAARQLAGEITTVALYASNSGSDIAAAEAYFGLPAGAGVAFYQAAQEALALLAGTDVDASAALADLAFQYDTRTPSFPI